MRRRPTPKARQARADREMDRQLEKLLGPAEQTETFSGGPLEIIERFALDAPLTRRLSEELEALLETYGERGLRALDMDLALVTALSDGLLGGMLEAKGAGAVGKIKRLNGLGNRISDDLAGSLDCPCCVRFVLAHALMNAQMSLADAVGRLAADRREGGDGQ